MFPVRMHASKEKESGNAQHCWAVASINSKHCFRNYNINWSSTCWTDYIRIHLLGFEKGARGIKMVAVNALAKLICNVPMAGG